MPVGDRRMISRTVVDSTRFHKIPATSQNLYFHFVVSEDDDGIVEACRVMTMCKAHEDDLRVLAGKQFVQMLNEDLVTYIIHWRNMNVLRADRKTDAIQCMHCGDTIESVKVHEYVTCSCGACSVDGGHDYLRRSYATSPEADYIDLSEYADVPSCSPGEVLKEES